MNSAVAQQVFKGWFQLGSGRKLIGGNSDSRIESCPSSTNNDTLKATTGEERRKFARCAGSSRKLRGASKRCASVEPVGSPPKSPRHLRLNRPVMECAHIHFSSTELWLNGAWVFGCSTELKVQRNPHAVTSLVGRRRSVCT